MLSQWREQGASLQDVNDALLLRQTIPPDMAQPEIIDGIMSDENAMAAFRADPEGTMSTIANAYRKEMERQQYTPAYSGPAPSGPYPGSPEGGPSVETAMAMIGQPVMPESSRQVLNSDPSLFRALAMAGGDFDPRRSFS